MSAPRAETAADARTVLLCLGRDARSTARIATDAGLHPRRAGTVLQVLYRRGFVAQRYLGESAYWSLTPAGEFVIAMLRETMKAL